MTWNRVRSLLVVSCIAAFVTVGCGQGSPLSTSGSPGTLVGPSALTADAEMDVATASSLTDTFGALGKGNGRGNSGSGGGNEKDKGRDEDGERGRHGDDDDDEVDVHVEDDDEDGERRGPGGRRGSLSGFVTAVSDTTLTVRGVVVTVNADTLIRHGRRVLTMADIQVGDKVQVKGTATTTTTAAVTETTFTATEIKVEDMDHDGDDDADDDLEDDDEDDDGVKAEGTIAALAGTCPALTFDVVHGTTTTTTTKVTTNAETKFDDVLCTALANDAVVEVKGTMQTDGSILATKVELE
jgi:hypothetical protein